MDNKENNKERKGIENLETMNRRKGRNEGGRKLKN